eukprot:359702-Chlamydomonas_euryale.AAC.6
MHIHICAPINACVPVNASLLWQRAPHSATSLTLAAAYAALLKKRLLYRTRPVQYSTVTTQRGVIRYPPSTVVFHTDAAH